MQRIGYCRWTRTICVPLHSRSTSGDGQRIRSTDATAKQAALDKAAEFAQKGLAVTTKPADMSDADFAKLKAQRHLCSTARLQRRVEQERYRNGNYQLQD